MNYSAAYRFLWFLVCLISLPEANSQIITGSDLDILHGLTVRGFNLSDSTSLTFKSPVPFYSFMLNDKPLSSENTSATKNGNEYTQVFLGNLKVILHSIDSSESGWKGDLIFKNIGTDTISISNIVPFGEDRSTVFITGKGPAGLARACLFRPGYQPLRVILPDNAWELGYSSVKAGEKFSVCAVARRYSDDGGVSKRYATLLPPNSTVTYFIHAEPFKGEWQNGLRKVFRDKYIYDVDKFENSLFEREDLSWIKESYIIILQMAWDREFYDRFSGKYTYSDFIRKESNILGKIDVFGLWPTWPRLGLDQRNQWDLYRDLPGGTEQLKNLVRLSGQYGTKFFVAYNPWDNSTRKEDHFRGMARLIHDTEADGVVLDTKGNSGPELQAAVDTVRKGVIMYSEGMAIPADMQGIISGRVHNAIFLSPELNLNKLIKPDFAIFRVCDVGEDILHREIAVAFFNGYGTELNMFRPGGRGETLDQDLEFLSETTFILRQNSDAFLDYDWTPLIETKKDSVFVNRWRSGDKTLYTILNMQPPGINDELIEVDNDPDKHYVSLWNHDEIQPKTHAGKHFLPVRAKGWNASFLNTRREGSVDCLAEFPNLIRSELIGDSVRIRSAVSGNMLIWKGNPSYKTNHVEFLMPDDTVIKISDIFGYYEGKIVLQLTDNKKLKDENVLWKKGGKPWMISKVIPTDISTVIPDDMVLVPGTCFLLEVKAGDEFILYPETDKKCIMVDSFLIDRYPVTNELFYEFIISSGYRPADTAGYLRHWQSGVFKQGQDKYPVVHVSYEDMSAYSRWAGKRLPTEAEWQLAAQGTDNRKWPWGNDFHGTYCNNSFARPTPVDAFFKGQSPYGVIDLVGNIWQMTNDIYFNGTNYFGVIRGGSYYKPDSSWWYLQGGPQSLDKTQIILMVSPGFDRSSAVGFRCVRDFDTSGNRLK